MHRTYKEGFTLIEILASISILAVMVLLLGNLFDQASRAWTQGEQEVLVHDLARGTLDEIFRDMTTTIADDILPFAVKEQFAMYNKEALNLAVEEDFYVSGCDAIYHVAAVAPREDGNEESDLYEICYFVEIDDNGRGRLMKRGHNIQGSYARHYAVSYQAGERNSYDELFRQGFFDDFTDTEVILENVYFFNITCWADAETSITDYYSKDADQGYLSPRYVDFEIALLTKEQWLRTNLYPSAGSDWHDFARLQAAVFQMTAAFPTRGR